jgi:hypothetical protein
MHLARKPRRSTDQLFALPDPSNNQREFFDRTIVFQKTLSIERIRDVRNESEDINGDFVHISFLSLWYYVFFQLLFLFFSFLFVVGGEV